MPATETAQDPAKGDCLMVCEDHSGDPNTMDAASSSSVTGETTRTTQPRGEVVHEPKPMDIICGRGSRITHPGNKRFRQIVLEQKELYQKAIKREDKTKITLDIVHRLMSFEEPSRYVCLYGRLWHGHMRICAKYNDLTPTLWGTTHRFLLKDAKSNCWYDVGFEYAKEKVSHALRSRPTDDKRKRIKPKKKAMRKPSFSPELERLVKGMIADQQSLLTSMIDQEMSSPHKPQMSSS